MTVRKIEKLPTIKNSTYVTWEEVVENRDKINEIIDFLGDDSLRSHTPEEKTKEFWHSQKCIAYKGKDMCNMNCLEKWVKAYPALTEPSGESSARKDSNA